MKEWVKKDKVWGQRPEEYPWIYDRIPKEPQDILEVGCGISHHHDGRDPHEEVNELTKKLAEDGHDVVGIDIKQLRWNHPNFFFMRADILDDFLEEHFDVVLASQVINHIGMLYRIGGETLLQHYDPSFGDRRFLKIVRERLRTEGKAIISTMIGDTGMSSSHSRSYNKEFLDKMFSEHFNILEHVVFKRDDKCSRIIYYLEKKDED